MRVKLYKGNKEHEKRKKTWHHVSNDTYVDRCILTGYEEYPYQYKNYVTRGVRPLSYLWYAQLPRLAYFAGSPRTKGS